MTEADIPALIHLGGIMHDESSYRALEYSPEKCAALGYQALVDPALLILTVLDDVKHVGLMICSVQAPEYSEDLIAWDVLTYVDAAYRGSRAALMLISAYREWARVRGAKMIFLRTCTGIDPEKTGKLFEHMGFRHIGGNYLMEV
jgi:GNAT superfamily N-acetyltransferase